MQALQKEREVYASGFPKQVQRGKYNLPLNERLRAAREYNKMTTARVITELKKIGVNIGQSSLKGYEACEASTNHRYPALPVLITLADFYGVSLDYLFGRTDEMFRDKDFFTSKGVNRNLELTINSGESLLWGRTIISPKQSALLKAHIELMISRS